jgi:tRNA(Arg) A34 adenosine deaminase TadA
MMALNNSSSKHATSTCAHATATKTEYGAYGAYEVILPRSPNERQDVFMRKAAQCAFRSNMTHRHGCIIVDGSGEIVSRGFNYKTAYHCHQFSMHAEIDALSKVKKSTDMSQYEMFVVRIGNESHGAPLKMSKPCNACTQAILKTNLRRVFFSIGT